MPRRSVFVIDSEMTIRWRWVTSPERRLPDVGEVLNEASKVAATAAGDAASGDAAS